MIKGNSIRKKTQMLLLGLTLGLTLVFSLLALLVAFVVEDVMLDNWITAQAHYIEQYFAQHGKLPSLPFEFMQVFASTTQLPNWMMDVVAQDPVAGEIFTPDKTHYHYRQLHLGQEAGYLLAEVSGLLVVSRQPEIFSIFLIVFMLALLAVMTLAIQFSKRIVNPIIQLSDAVKNNDVVKNSDAGNTVKESKIQSIVLELHEELPDELAYLAEQLQESFDKRDQLLQREKEFSTNVSHELRTPLTLLKNAGALIKQRGFKDNDLVVIDNACEHMQRTVDILFALARTESLPVETCRVDCILEGALLKCQPWLKHFQIDFPLSIDAVLLGNPQLLELLFINLLRNAAEHASEPLLVITYSEGLLAFENKTDECPVLDMSKPGHKSEKSHGIGQGLYLIKRIANQFYCGFSVQIHNHYFKAVLHFPF